MAVLIKKDKKTGKSYRIVTPDWDWPMPVLNGIAPAGMGMDLSISSHMDDIIQSGLVLYYDASNLLSYTASNSGLWKDMSPPTGSGYNLTLANSPTVGNIKIPSTTPPYSQSLISYLNFNGTNQSGNVNDGTYTAFGSGSFSVSVWFNPAQWSFVNNSALIDKWSNATTTNGWAITSGPSGGGTGINYLRGIVGTKLITSNTTVSTNTWQNWTFVEYVSSSVVGGNTIYSSSLYLYKNGLLDTSSLMTAFTAPVTYTGNLNVGLTGVYFSSPAYYSGSISSVAIYNTALTANQVLTNYNIKAAKFGLPTYTASIGGL